jgi:hypothetical protein
MWTWLTGRRDRQRRIENAARELVASHGAGARDAAIAFARLTRDGKQVEDGKDAQFWWRVVIEIDKLPR